MSSQDKSLGDVAKEAATKAKEAINSEKAREAAEKAKEAAIKAKEKVTEYVGEHEEQITSAIDKAGSFVDEKITKGRFTEKIDKAQDVAKNAVGKIASSAGTDETPDAGTGPASPTTGAPDPGTSPGSPETGKDTSGN